MSSFLTRTKVAIGTVPNAAAGKLNEFVDSADGHAKAKDETGAVQIYSGTAAVAAHVAAPDPHPQYLTPTEAGALYDPAGAASTVQSNLSAHLADTGNPHPQYVQPDDALFVTPQVVVVKTNDAGLGEFTSLSDAIASITDADSITKPYVIEIGAGVHTVANPIVIPSGVSIRGAGINATTIEPTTASQHLFVMSEMCEISFLNLRGITGSIGSGKAAIYCEDIGDFGQLHKLSIYDFDIPVTNYANTANSTLYCEYVDVNGDYTFGAKTTSNSPFKAYTQLENFYTYGSAATNPIHIYGSGTTTQVVLNSTGLSGADDNKGIFVENGATITTSDTLVRDFTGTLGEGFVSANTGSGPFIDVSGITFSNNTKDISIDNPNTTGSITATADKTKTTVEDLADITIFIADSQTGGISFTGELNYSATDFSKIADIGPLVSNSSTMGVFKGGELSVGSGRVVNVAALKGYISTGLPPNDIIKYFQLGAQAITVSANANNYIYINSSGTLVQNAAAPDTRENILLGRGVTNSTDVLFIERAPLDSQHYSNKIDRVFREAIGAIYATGSLVSENGTRGLNVTAGEYYYSEIEFTPAGGTGISWDSFYQSSTPGVYTRVAGVSTVDNAFYDNGSGTLQAIPTSKHVKHLLMTIGGPSEKYILIYGTASYTTLAEAQAAPLPVVPAYMNGAFVRVCSIIIQHGNPNIQDIIDERPRVGFASSSSVRGLTDHGALAGLGDDDHTQYILVNGTRAFTGSQSFGGNNITSVGTVNGVIVETHASRHLPNGADPLATAAPVAIGSTLAAGTANSFSRADHVHILPDVGTASTYGSASQVPVITTDAKGRIISVVNTAISIVASAVSNFAAAVRAVALTGLSLTDSNDVVDTDTVLQSIGKLQAQNNLWNELVVTSAINNTSSTTLSSITELAFPVVNGNRYRIEAMLIFQSVATTTGIALTMGNTGSTGELSLVTSAVSGGDGTTSIYSGAITAFGDLVIATSTGQANTSMIAKIEGIFVCTTSGTLTPQFRSEVNGNQVTVRIGSNIIVRKF